MKKLLNICCLLVVFVCSGCSENEAKKKNLLAEFALPTDLHIEILPNSAGLKTTINYKEFLNIKSNLKGYSPWHSLGEASIIEAKGLSISDIKGGTYTYSTGGSEGGFIKVLVYDKESKIFYALFAIGLI